MCNFTKKITTALAAGATLAMLTGVCACGNGNTIEQAKAACAKASDTLRVNTNHYNNLKNNEGAAAADITADQVNDPKTVEELREKLNEEKPILVACNTDSADELQDRTKKIEENADWYQKHTADLHKAIDNVNASKK